MHAAPLRAAVDRLRRLAGPAAASDAELLGRFAARRDADAFAALVERHGAMVLGVCRRLLADAHAAEDAFQATFLALARRAGALHNRSSLAGWLHTVARRHALRARDRAPRPVPLPAEAPAPGRDPLAELTARELVTVLDAEVARLPGAYRLAVVLCCLEGLTQEEAARRLGWSPGSVKGRLERGRALLRRRLERRGLGLGAALLALEASRATAVPPGLVHSATREALAGGSASPAAATLARGMLPLARLRATGAALFLAAVAGVGTAALAVRPGDATPDPEPPATLPAAGANRVDRFGDPLPAGVALRLGTVRRRAVGAMLALTSDGRSLVGVRGGKYISVWDAATGQLKETRVLPGGPRDLAVLSPDGSRLLTDGDGMGKLTLWDVDKGEVVRTLAIPGAYHLKPAAFSADGRRVAVFGKSEKWVSVRAWDVATGERIFARDVPNARFCNPLAFTPDGKRILASFNSDDSGTCCWDVATGELAWRNKDIGQRSFLFTADGKVFYPGGNAPTLDAATGRPAAPPKLPPISWDSRLTLAPDGRMLLVSSAEGVLVWDLAEGKELRRRPQAGEDVVVAPDGKTAVTNGGMLQRWDLASGRALWPDNFDDGHAGEVTLLAFSADGRRLASGSGDGSVRLWDAATGRPLHVWRGHEASRPMGIWRWTPAGVSALDLSPDGRWVLSAGTEGRVRLRDAASGREVRVLELPPPDPGAIDPRATQVHVSPDGARATALIVPKGIGMIVPGPAPVVRSKLATWDARTGRLTDCRPVEDGQLAPDGRTLLSKRALIDVASGKEVTRLDGGPEPSGPRGSFAFSQDSRLVAGQFENAKRQNDMTRVESVELRVWEAATGKTVARLRAGPWLGLLAFHPDSRFVANNGFRVEVWDLLTGKPAAARGAPEQIHSSAEGGAYTGCLAFMPDGRRLATGHPDGTVLLWDLPPLPRTPAPPTAAERDALLADLAGADAAKAWRAVWRLGDAPDDAVRVAGEGLKPVSPAPADEVRSLLADLDGESFAQREAAAKRLKELGPRAGPALREALRAGPAAEGRKRAEALLAALESAGPPAAGEVRQLRALAVLERAGTADARRLLADLAGGAADARLTREAKGSLDRLAHRPAP